jgi:preprotein translocase subunit SecG
MGIAGYVSVCVQALLCWLSLSHYMFRSTWPSSGVYICLKDSTSLLFVAFLVRCLFFHVVTLCTNTHARKQQNSEENSTEKTQMENVQCDHVKKKAANQKSNKKQRSRILQAYENKYPIHLKMAM